MNISDKCEKGNVFFGDSCEHCHNIEPLSVIWCDGGTWWCLVCARFMFEFNLTPKEITVIKELSKHKKVEYYENRIKELNTY